MSQGDADIIDVWAYNLEDTLYRISKLYQQYPIVVFDTEFPGNVAVVPPGLDVERQPYEYVKENIDMTSIIQLGLTFMDANGSMPEPSTWQFNFRYILEEGKYSTDSIELLQRSGIDFDRLGREGIDPVVFSYCFVASGLPFNKEIQWVAFHSSYDFCYLSKTITLAPMPDTFSGFCSIVRRQFPRLVDVKSAKVHGKSYKQQSWKGGLERLAAELDVSRTGTTHQAGSDALLTARIFGRMMKQLDGPPAFKEVFGLVYGMDGDTRIE